jgi:tellurite resistance protein
VQAPSISSAPATIPPQSVASIRNLPVNLFASVMGLSGLSLAWRTARNNITSDFVAQAALISEAIGAVALLVFALLCIGYITKLAMYPRSVQAEFCHPISGNFFGTIAISVLLISALVAPYAAPVAQGIWMAGALMTFAQSFVVVSRLLKGQVDASHAVPAWLISGVATLDIAVTGLVMPMAWAAEFNLFAGAVGAVLALVMYAMIVSRLVHREPLARLMTPSLMILVAPFAVGFLAYTNIVGGIDRFAAVLFYFGLFMFVVIAPKVFHPSVKFSPAWWAISFPLAALTNAALRYAQFLSSRPLFMLAIALLTGLTVVLLILTVLTARMVINGKLFK